MLVLCHVVDGRNTCSCQGGYDNLEVCFACQVVGTCASTEREIFLVMMNQF